MRKSFLMESFYKKTLGCLILAFLLLLPLAKADTYLTDCAVLDTPGETYYLTQDIINSTASICMNIQADNIVLDCQGHIIDGTGTVNTYGIYISRSSPTTTNETIKNCVVTDWIYGIYLYYSDSNTLSNITANITFFFPYDSYGIHLDHSNYNILSNIIASYNSWGIYIYNSNYNILSNITTNYNERGVRGNGIEIYHSDSNTLSNITANYNNLVGIRIYNSSSSTLSNITVNYNKYGIVITNSNSTIKNSIIQDNSQFGISIAGSAPNLIYNNLFNNTVNFYFSGTIYANYWNTTRQAGTRIYSFGNEIGGNYWTNPEGTGYSDTCTDADKDGFCDDPYVLATDNVDYLALSDEYSPPPTTTLPPVHGVPLLSSTLVGVVIGFGIITFMLRTLFDIREPKRVIEYFIALAVIVLTVITLITLFA
jgi:parallel beta-helix repeat protein